MQKFMVKKGFKRLVAVILAVSFLFGSISLYSAEASTADRITMTPEEDILIGPRCLIGGDGVHGLFETIRATRLYTFSTGAGFQISVARGVLLTETEVGTRDNRVHVSRRSGGVSIQGWVPRADIVRLTC